MASNASIDFRSPNTWLVVTVLALLALFSIAGAVTPSHKTRLPVGEFVEAHAKKYSQHDEELLIRHFFQDKPSGVYVDVGCAWPQRNSTTFYLEQHLGWTGIGIDAVEHYAEAWKALRPRSKFLHYAVCDQSGGSITFHQSEWSGVSSLSEEHVVEYSKQPSKPVQVSAITLNDVLENEGIDSFDFLSMDIEGAEPLALAGFDIERYKPKLVCIEMHEGAENDEVVHAYFTEHGYTRIDEYLAYDFANWYYTPST